MAKSDKPKEASAPLPSGTPSSGTHVLDALWTVIEDRAGASEKTSYTAKLLSRGTVKIANKVGEEAVETVVAATAEGPDAVVSESADLLYHLLVLWKDAKISPDQVWAELAKRFDLSGLEEKARRWHS